MLMALVSAVALTGCTDRSGGTNESVLSTWYEQTYDAVGAQGPPPDPAAARTWALAWWAADRAIAGREDGPFVDAAVASAVHDVLVALVPERKEALDDALDEDADEAGSVAGKKQAAEVLAERSNDGLDGQSVERPLAVPVPAPGVWRPTPPELQEPRQAGVPDATPFFCAPQTSSVPDHRRGLALLPTAATSPRLAS